MKNTMKMFLMISLFCATTFAGDMGAGGNPPPPCTENCSNGLISNQNSDVNEYGEIEGSESILDKVGYFLDSIFLG